jgi:hypothetical protein
MLECVHKLDNLHPWWSTKVGAAAAAAGLPMGCYSNWLLQAHLLLIAVCIGCFARSLTGRMLWVCPLCCLAAAGCNNSV